MIFTVVAVHDRVAKTYGRPFFTQNINVAIRSFTDEINNATPDNQLYQHPDDFDLFYLGTFDDSIAEFHIDEKRCIAVGKDLAFKLKSTE